LRWLEWNDLAPATAPEDNPFAALSDAQADQLRELAVSRLLVQRLGSRSDAVARRQVRISGTVRVRPQVQNVTMVDGVLAVPSGYAVEDATVTPMDNPAGSSANLGR
jgi:hypothetical protein